MWEQAKLLLPSIGGHWVLMMALFTCGWYFFTKFQPGFTFKWQVPVVAATVMQLYTTTNMFVNMYQNTVLFTYQQAMQQAQAQAQQQQQQQQPQQAADPVLQMKSNFLGTVERLVQNPEQITPENKQKLFEAFKGLFADKKARTDFSKNIGDAYQCQLYFWEDALAAYKSKQPVKSNERKACEKKSGDFFNREKLLSVETVKGNDTAIAEIAAGTKRVPASDGKQVEVTEAMLRDALNAQIKATYNVKKIFE